MNYKDFLKNKKVAVIGLGPHGEMMADIKFLLKNKAYVTLHDMRSDAKLRGFVPELKEAGLFAHSFGTVHGDDLLMADLVLISPEISKKSSFLKKALEAGIQIEYPDTLFFKLAPSITLIGVMGLYGKTMVSHLLYAALKKGFAELDSQGLFLMDTESPTGVLSHLKKIKKGDVVIARIPENMAVHYRDIHMSPHVAVVTSPISFSLLEFQTHNNFIVAPDSVMDMIRLSPYSASKAKMLRTRPTMIPTEWNLPKKSAHDRDNMALVLQASELFKVPQDVARETIENYAGLKHRIEFVKKVKGIEYYNDAYSAAPRSTVSALKTLATGKNIVLILGGAYTGHDNAPLIEVLPEYVSRIILLPGSGSLGIRPDIEALADIQFIHALTLEDAVSEAERLADKSEKVLFSPGFEAVGVDISRKGRGERFVKAVRGL